jgi:ATP-dependent RNA helicase RhlE
MTFQELSLKKEILKALEEKGYTEPTVIQKQAIPLILQRVDILAGSQTGTGKTASFVLPLLHLLAKKNPEKHSIRALILTPTRELAIQVEASIKTYGKYLPLKSAAVFGGVSIHGQKVQLSKGVDILVATPGRLLDLIGQKLVFLSAIEFFVLDEADRMLDMGFIADIRKVLKLLPSKKQSLLFSATFSKEIKALATTLLQNPQFIQATKENTSTQEISQVVHPVDNKRKKDLLSHLISSQNLKQVLVFTRTKHVANRLSSQLEAEGISAAAIHGNKSQNARVKALNDFKQGSIRVLVATDIAARGLDIQKLPYVINFELPQVAEDYIHRIGRTGRAGHAGNAISLVCIDEHKLLFDIEKLLRTKIPQVIIDDFKPNPSIAAQPILQRRGQRPGNGKRPSARKVPLK